MLNNGETYLTGKIYVIRKNLQYTHNTTEKTEK